MLTVIIFYNTPLISWLQGQITEKQIEIDTSTVEETEEWEFDYPSKYTDKSRLDIQH